MNKQKQRITIAEDQAARFHDEIARRQEVARANKELDLQERDQLRAEVERLSALGSWALTCIHHTDEERKAWAACPCCTNARAERAEAALADPQQLHAHCLRTLNEGQIAHLFGGRMTEIVNRAEAELATERDAANSRADRAEAEAERYRLVTLRQDAEIATAKERLRSEAMDDYASIKDLQRELATEREKLDWVFQNCKVEANDYTTGNRDVYYVHDREDLGVAMKEDAK